MTERACIMPSTPDVLVPGSADELQRFEQLKRRLVALFEDANPHAPRTVVVVPSLSLDQEILANISGIHHYEEPLLCMLMLLRQPRTHVIYVTSQPIDRTIIDYYLHLLPGVPGSHARKRLTLLSCHDASPVPLTQKILDRPRLMRRLLEEVAHRVPAYLICYIAMPLERTLAVQLAVPLYGPDPAYAFLGSKSGSRDVFREAGIQMAQR